MATLKCVVRSCSPRRSLSASKAGKIRTPSRFEEEFEEIDELGKGGFGSVYEVRNKLDGRRYAIKKIQLAEVNPEDCLKVSGCFHLSLIMKENIDGLYLLA